LRVTVITSSTSFVGATRATRRLYKRSITRASAQMEQSSSGQIGQPADKMIENKRVLSMRFGAFGADARTDGAVLRDARLWPEGRRCRGPRNAPLQSCIPAAPILAEGSVATSTAFVDIFVEKSVRYAARP